MHRSRNVTSSTLRSTHEKLDIAMDLDSVTGRPNDSRVAYVATEIIKKEIASSVLLELENCNKVKFVNGQNPSGSTIYHCFTEDLNDITFSVSGTVDRRSDFCVVPKSVPLGHKMNTPRVDRYVVKLRLDSRTFDSTMKSVQGKEQFSLYLFGVPAHRSDKK